MAQNEQMKGGENKRKKKKEEKAQEYRKEGLIAGQKK